MDTIDVYVENILPRQIAKRLSCPIEDYKAIKEERENFRKFLRGFTAEKIEDIFFNQLEAWEVYDRDSLVDYLADDTINGLEDFEEPNWSAEIYEIIDSKVNSWLNLRNYTDSETHAQQ